MKKILVLCALFSMGKLMAQELKYTNCDNCWNADSLGTHRVLVFFEGTGKAARVRINWRRRDEQPQLKRIIVQDAQTQQKINNVSVLSLNRESGEIVFEPVSGKGNYYIYYMPYKNEGRSNYPRGTYLKPETTASAGWLASFNTATLQPNATAKEIQSIDAFNSFYPMEVIATAAETKQLTDAHAGKALLVFPEDREYSTRLQHDLPYRWIQKGVGFTFNGTALKGEYYAYQLGVYALRSLHKVQVEFSDLTSADGYKISSKTMNCINTEGTGYDAKAISKEVDVPSKTIQALWCGIDVPVNTIAGTYKGKAVVKAAGIPAETINITITVTNQVAVNGGENEPWKQTRLKWLNSTLAQENKVIAPYTPLKAEGKTINFLGRKLILKEDGLPAGVQTFFTEEMTSFSHQPKNILSAPMQLLVRTTGDDTIRWKQQGLQYTHKTEGTVQWQSRSFSGKALQLDVKGSLEFDGFASYTVALTALQDMNLADIQLLIPYEHAAADYIMGLGLKGEKRPAAVDWKWEVATKNQDGAWIGSVNAGMQFSLRDEHYVRPLNTNFYLQKPLLLPVSWGNEGKGGIRITEDKQTVWVNNYSGSRLLKKGETLYYNFNLLITPFHPINTDFQWSTRFYHKYENLDTIKNTDATVVNIHHATPINPWINYPFIEHRKMKAYIDEAHRKGLKVKIYNTVRELSNHAYETFALRSLGHEVYSPGKGGGFSWLQEHVDSDYIAAWFVPEIKDAAIVNSGMNRWHNYYVEGMNWLTKNVGIDGIYLDDVAFDRITMKRIKRALTQDAHPGIIDLHSANQYNKNDGFNNSANLYMEHFPYLNRLWFGEYFDYEKNSPDFFLTEVSGIPFGLMGEMLQDGGNPWRGMIYGMTNRMPWSDNADPRPFWKLWDDFGMKGSEMIGYWSRNCPVSATNPQVMATVYKQPHTALVSLASWATADTETGLKINWTKLGIDPARAVIEAPEIKGLQQHQVFRANSQLPVAKQKGWLLLIREVK